MTKQNNNDINIINDIWYEKCSAIKPINKIDTVVIRVHNVVAIDMAVPLVEKVDSLSIVFSIDVWIIAYKNTIKYIKHIIIPVE